MYFHFTAHSIGLFYFNALVVKLYFIFIHKLSIVFLIPTATTLHNGHHSRRPCIPPHCRWMSTSHPTGRCRRAATALPPPPPPPRCCHTAAPLIAMLLPHCRLRSCCRQRAANATIALPAADTAAFPPHCLQPPRRRRRHRCTATKLPPPPQPPQRFPTRCCRR